MERRVSLPDSVQDPTNPSPQRHWCGHCCWQATLPGAFSRVSWQYLPGAWLLLARLGMKSSPHWKLQVRTRLGSWMDAIFHQSSCSVGLIFLARHWNTLPSKTALEVILDILVPASRRHTAFLPANPGWTPLGNAEESCCLFGFIIRFSDGGTLRGVL